MVDGSRIFFDLDIFFGFIKQCFGYNGRGFSRLALEADNTEAFNLAHKALSSACDDDTHCIRLAYCALGSTDKEVVWPHLPGDIQDRGCSYESFIEEPEEPEEPEE